MEIQEGDIQAILEDSHTCPENIWNYDIGIWMDSPNLILKVRPSDTSENLEPTLYEIRKTSVGWILVNWAVNEDNTHKYSNIKFCPFCGTRLA